MLMFVLISIKLKLIQSAFCKNADNMSLKCEIFQWVITFFWTNGLSQFFACGVFGVIFTAKPNVIKIGRFAILGILHGPVFFFISISW